MQLGPSMKAQKEELRKPSGSPQEALRKPSGSPQDDLKKPSGSLLLSVTSRNPSQPLIST